MKKQILLIGTIVASTLMLSACSNNASTGAVIGSLVGAGIGKSTSNHHDRRALVGGALGAIAGAAIGAEQDRQRGTTSTATTSPYYEQYEKPANSTTSTNVRHTHRYSSGDKVHTHSGGTTQHSHNEPGYVYNNSSYYPSNTRIVIGSSYYKYPRRHHRYRGHHRHRGHGYHRNRHNHRH